MRIGIVTDWTTTGAGEVSSNLAKILLMQGNEVFIFARFDTYGKPMANVGQARIYWANNPFSPHAKAINKREIKRWVVENSIDLVLFNEQIWIAPVIWVKELGVFCVAYIDYYREDTVKNFQIYDGLICNTLRHLSVFNWHKGVIYIPWGVDPSVFSRSDIQADETIFFHSCGTSPQRKGTDIFLKSLHIKTELRGVIHSQKPLVELLPEHEQLITKLMKEDRLLNVVGDIPAPGCYQMGSVYVYPNRLDGLGITVFEALASGLPVVATDSAPINEVVIPANGVLIPPTRTWARSDGYYWPQYEISPEDLAHQLVELRNNPQTVRTLSAGALKTAEEDLNLFDNFQNLSSFLNQLSRVDSSSTTMNYSEFAKERITIRSTRSTLYLISCWHKARFYLFGFLRVLIKVKKVFRNPN